MLKVQPAPASVQLQPTGSWFFARDFGATFDGVTDDTAAIAGAMAAAATISGIVVLPAGTAIISSPLTLSPNISIMGAGSSTTVLKWNGAAGGTVLATAALTAASPNYSGRLEGFAVSYPSALIASGSQGIYIAMPNGVISDVSVRSDVVAAASTAGAYGMILDGTANSGPFPVFGSVSGPWEYCWYVRCNHANLMACSAAYGGMGLAVDEDSLASASGPPYNVYVSGFHGFTLATAMFDIIRVGTEIQLDGGFSEGSQTVLRVESTAGNTVYMNGTSTNGGVRLVHYGTGFVIIVDPQDQLRSTIYSGQSTGAPQVYDYPAQRRIFWNPANYSTASTTPVALGSNPVAIHNGPAGMFHIVMTGQAYSNSIGDSFTLGLWQSNVVTQGAALTGNGAFPITLTQEGAASNPIPFTIEWWLGGQNTNTCFTLGVTAGAGTVTVQNLNCLIEPV